MKPLPRKQGLPDDSGMAIGIETMTVTPSTVTPSESLSRSSAVRFGKGLNVAVGVLIAVVAASGWLYLITISVDAFVCWL